MDIAIRFITLNPGVVYMDLFMSKNAFIVNLKEIRNQCTLIILLQPIDR